MKKVAFHSYQLGERGTEICLWKYAYYARKYLNVDPIIISTSSRPHPTYNMFKREFETILYPDKWIGNGKNDSLRLSLESFSDKFKIEYFYAIKGGENDGFMPTNTKRLAHAIFRMDQPHGDVYAGVCDYINDKYGGKHPVVYHIIEKDLPSNEDDFRMEMNIPKDVVVLGRHGGNDTFNIPFVKTVIRDIICKRPNLYFLFLNTEKFMDHERIKYIDWTDNMYIKTKFVNTCDAMIHARKDGEIFSLSLAEFSVRNRPIITWKPKNVPSEYDTGHFNVLKDRAFYYEDQESLKSLLLNLTKKDFEGDWDVYGDKYGPEKVMKSFDEIFLQ